MSPRRAALLAVALTALVACGTTAPRGGGTPSGSGSAPAASPLPGASASNAPTPAPTAPIPAPPGTVVLTEQSAGATYTVSTGQHVEAVLPGDGRQYHGYTVPASDTPSVLAATGQACAAPSGDFCTDFRAVAPGSASLTSTWDPACRQAIPPCGVASRAWRAGVTVR